MHANVASYSSAGFRDRDTERALEAIAAAGFCAVEIMGQEPHVSGPPVGRALADLRGLLTRLGLRAPSVHGPMRRNVLGPPEESWRKEKTAVFASYLRFAAEIGAGNMVVHPVPNPMFVDDPHRTGIGDAMVQAAQRSLDELLPVTEETGVRILLENLPYACTFPLLTMPELREFVDPYPPESVGLVFDTGHAGAKLLDPVAEIRAGAGRINGTHLEDINWGERADNHWIPTHGSLDWEGILAALRDIQYDGEFTFEVVYGRNEETPEELARLSREIAVRWGLTSLPR